MDLLKRACLTKLAKLRCQPQHVHLGFNNINKPITLGGSASQLNGVRSLGYLRSLKATEAEPKAGSQGHCNQATLISPSAGLALSGIIALIAYTFLKDSEGDIQLAPRILHLGDGSVGDRLCQAASRGDLAYLTQYFNKTNSTEDINIRHQLGWACIHAAAVKGHYEIVEFLLENGADPNLQDTYRFPSQAVGFQIRQIIYEREEIFSDSLNYRSQASGFTALHYACFRGDEEMIRLLCEKGADPGIQTDLGWRPVDLIDSIHPRLDKLKKILETSKQKLEARKKQEEKELRVKYPIEQQLHEAIVGQVAPINAVASAIRRKENDFLGWHDEDRPLVFLFLGSSGVGKTELAKQIAKYLHSGSQDAFIRVDMSEFQSKHDVAKFVGSPPGYIGYEEGGQLTAKLSKCPNAVVLLDEVEKAHPDVLTIMLQVFDEGRLTDGKGTTVDCKDAIFIMTSNLAQQEIADEAESLRHEAMLRGKDVSASPQPVSEYGRKVVDEGVASTPLSKRFIDTTVYPILRNHFGRDEFLGRISSILYFLPFDRIELERIVEMELQRWATKAKSRHNMELSWSKDVLKELSNGYNLRYGARSIKHEVEARVISPLAKAHELDHVKDGSNVHFTVDDKNRIQLHMESNPKAPSGKDDPRPRASFFGL
ncbi:hypothetical protein DSO57_1039244 [Entomophthora muscae]|uniref:Uncharacterized protein n=1 Tax=Entomophthora muscae TaxID=34485 RepID=A0ACC2TWL4_9FUNG|nr:hypothetical protein DSO57_1039244 [Entomophthora muscae]